MKPMASPLIFLLLLVFWPVSADVFGLGQFPPVISPLITQLNSNIWQLGLSVPFSTIAAGANFIGLIDNNGYLYTLGQNDYGELGLGDYAARGTPCIISSSVVFTSLHAGDYHFTALDTAMGLWTWGRADSGQLGRVSAAATPAKLPFAESVTATAAGSAHSLALGASGNVYSFGSSQSGQLGLGDFFIRYTPTLVPLSSQNKVISIASGSYHSLALTAQNVALGWGSNFNGQLGLPMAQNISVSTAVAINVSAVAAIFAGANCTLVVSINGLVFALGDNSQGQFGLGDTAMRGTPTLLSPALAPLTAAAFAHNFALFAANNQLFAAGNSPLIPTRRISSSSLITIVGFSGNILSASGSAGAGLILTSGALLPTASAALSTGAIIAIAVAGGVVFLLALAVLFVILRRRNNEKKSMRTIKVQSEARMRLGMALGEDILALEDHTHRTWSMMPNSKTQGSESDLSALSSRGEEPLTSRKKKSQVEELDQLPPWKPSENDEPIMAFRIVTNLARIKACRIASALLLLKCPGVDKKVHQEAAAILQEYSSVGDDDTLSNPLTNESMEEDYEPPQLEASVVPGPVHGWLRQRAELQAKAELDAIALVNEFRKTQSSQRSEPEIGLT